MALGSETCDDKVHANCARQSTLDLASRDNRPNGVICLHFKSDPGFCMSQWESALNGLQIQSLT